MVSHELCKTKRYWTYQCCIKKCEDATEYIHVNTVRQSGAIGAYPVRSPIASVDRDTMLITNADLRVDVKPYLMILA